MTTLIAVVSLFPIVLVGALLPFLGLPRRGVLFGVTVPLDFAASASARAAVHRYRLAVSLVSGIILLVAALLLVIHRTPLLPIVSAIGIPLELAAGLFFWQRERARVKLHAITVPLVRTAELLPQRPLGALYASLAALLPLGLTALWLQAHWVQIPDRWPHHWNAAGIANGWATRSTLSVFSPLLAGALVVALLTAVSAFIAVAPGPQTRQRRNILAPLAGLTWLCAGLFCVIAFLPLRHSVSPMLVLTAVVLHMALTAGIVVWLLLRSGTLDPDAQPAYDSTPDSGWRGGGLIYYNPADAAVLVAKRYGIGWTLNFARPAAWVYVSVLLLFVLGSVLLPRITAH